MPVVPEQLNSTFSKDWCRQYLSRGAAVSWRASYNGEVSDDNSGCSHVDRKVLILDGACEKSLHFERRLPSSVPDLSQFGILMY